MAVVNNLKTIREERGLLQEDLASATGFCTKTIGRVERGERAPSAEFMLRIATYFNLLVEDVFKLENSGNIVVTGFVHGLIVKGRSVFITDKNDPHRGQIAAVVGRIETEGGKPAIQAADCHAALEIVDGKSYDLRAGMYLYRERSL